MPKGYRFSIKFSEVFSQGLVVSAAGGRSGQTRKTAGSESTGKAA
jgi:hypothetical protein